MVQCRKAKSGGKSADLVLTALELVATDQACGRPGAPAAHAQAALL